MISDDDIFRLEDRIEPIFRKISDQTIDVRSLLAKTAAAAAIFRDAASAHRAAGDIENAREAEAAAKRIERRCYAFHDAISKHLIQSEVQQARKIIERAKERV